MHSNSTLRIQWATLTRALIHVIVAESEYALGLGDDVELSFLWIANLNPQLILLSVYAGDSQGLPSSEILQASEGYELLRTDQNGWIEITTDGERMWVEVERK